MKLVQTENPSIFLALKCLINFSEDMTSVRVMCKYGIVNRLYDVLKENVRQDLKNDVFDKGETTNSAKENKDARVFELVRDIKLDPTTGKIIEQDKQEQTIEMCFMLLSNVTAHEVGQKHVLGIPETGEEKGKFEFIIAESIFGMFCYFSKNTAFDFVANIMANLACLKEGRNFMVDHHYIEAMVVQMVTKYLNTHRRKYLIACIRNLLFEYKKYSEKFMEMNVPRDICKVLIDEQGITKDQLPEAWQLWGAKAGKAEEAIDMQNSQLLIDGLILLANNVPLLKRMHEIDCECILPLIRLPKTPEFEDTVLRIEVMTM